MYGNSLIMRLLTNCILKLGVAKDIERKHLEAIIDLAKNSPNGAKINLPHNLDVYKEYDYVTIAYKKPKLILKTEYDFKIGTISFGDYGKLRVKKSKQPELVEGSLLIDLDKVPANAKWRVRKEGDYIQKFGGGTKKLKSYLIDKKIPARERDCLPVLASGNEILAIAGIEISEKVKVEDDVKTALKIEIEKNKN